MHQITTPKTQIIGAIGNRIDRNRLAHDIHTLESSSTGINGFSDYWSGLIKVYALWNGDGDYKNSYYSEHAEVAKKTNTCQKVSYIASLVENFFDIAYLRCARVYSLENGGFLLPHRDFLELENNFIRLNIPIKTNPQCLYSEELNVYHMNFGEIWFLNNGDNIHSAINFSAESRLHLILDFKGNVPFEALLKDNSVMTNSAKPENVRRPKFTKEDLENIYKLSGIITSDNLKEIVSILGKIHFHKEVSPDATYEWLQEIGARTQNKALRQKIEDIIRVFIGPMKDSTVGQFKSIWHD